MNDLTTPGRTGRPIRMGAGPLALLIVLQSCAVNPVTGERQLMLVSESQEIAMGAEAARSTEQSIGLVDNPDLQAYVQDLGLRLAADSERPDLPWSFKVVDDPTPNAFALPGGYIYVTRGLLALMENEAELASVLGHEIGHVTARHSAAMMSRAQVAQIGLGVGMILSPELAQFGDLAMSGLSLLFLSYGRDAERQADDLGFQYSLRENYDVREMVDVFAALQRAGELAGASRLPAWMASHPYPEERIERIQAQLAALDRPLDTARVGSGDFMNYIDGLTYGENPRQGFFEDNLFMHPEMEFEIRFPAGWQTRNLTQMVQAASPDQDAAAQLMIAQGTPGEAARQFLSLQGVTPGRFEDTRVNGMPAVIGQFQAAAQSGTVAGLVAFIQYRDSTYQILTYTPAARLDYYYREFISTIDSFDRLTDAEALARRADEIEIVRTDRAMTLAEFDRRYPSEVELETLALINQLPGAEMTIPAGTQMKRIVRGG